MRSLSLLTIFFSSVLLARGDDPQGVEFFEKKIRPVLDAHCSKCHSAEAEKNNKLRGGLILDTRGAMLTGGDSGPALVPGKAAESRMVKTLKYEDEVKMPPKGKLPDAVIADIEKWINLGAIDPRGEGSGTRKQIGLSFEEGRKFWSYKQPEKGTLPKVKAEDWPINDLDRFILAGLEAKGLQPAADADRSILARRLYYDLTGLPPTPEQVDAFVKDPSTNAYGKLVDTLLASPEFGERWGRHWLDVARFGESLTLRGFILNDAWRYRDYVIEAFNDDLPFDRFIHQQIAGDLLPAKDLHEQRQNLIATTFLAIGNTNLEEQDKKQLRMDVVDEQLDVISKGFLGQTITCARCHDHKFDPIPTKDYYALAGILRNSKSLEHANVSKWLEVPLPVDPIEETKLKKHEEAVASLQARIKAEKMKGTKTAVVKGVLPIKEVPGIVVDDRDAKKVGTWMDSTSTPIYIGEGYVHDMNMGKGEKSLTFDPKIPANGKYEVRLAYSHGTSRATNVPVTVFSAEGEKTISVDMTQAPPIEGRYVSLGVFKFEKTGQSFVIISNEGTQGHVTADAVVFLPHEDPTDQKATPATRKEDTVTALEAELKKLQASGPQREMAITVLEEKQIEESKVHVRGSVHNLGDLAPRGFLKVATYGTPPQIPKNQSGRKELAEWIASKENPLTSRVIANRAWHWIFGSGIVGTVDNFGTTGEKPSHPELLDYLALQFVEDGWSMKKLIRRIVLSRTYRQSSMIANPAAMKVDPENRLFWRANRKRLEAEAIRDTILSISGKLNRDRGGPNFPANLAADYAFKPNDLRRSVYAPIFRNALPELFEVFDFADSSMVTGRRNVSTVAPQALFMMNNPFVLEQAKYAGSKLLELKLDIDPGITQVYRLTLGREPTPGERKVAKKFLDVKKEDPQAAWGMLFQALFASADFRYLN